MDEKAAADRQVIAVLIALALAFVMHAAGMASSVGNVIVDVMNGTGIAELGAGGSPEEQGEVFGRTITFVVCGLYSLFGLVVIPVLGWGVHRRAAWGRTGALVYFATTLGTCCCTPMGAFGIYALMRADVRRQFGGE